MLNNTYATTFPLIYFVVGAPYFLTILLGQFRPTHSSCSRETLFIDSTFLFPLITPEGPVASPARGLDFTS